MDTDAVHRLVARQFPRWAGLPLTPVRSAGTDNLMYRLGTDMAVRLPRIPRAVTNLVTEQRWLPLLAPVLPLPVPLPLTRGEPDDTFPYPWSVCRWLDGHKAVEARFDDPTGTARLLGRFVAALHSFDATGGPESFRGGPVAEHDAEVRAFGVDAVLAAWETARAAPPWTGPPVWVHADLHPANLLCRNGKLAGVLDFGGLGTGDPACDTLPAWTLFDRGTRDVFRAESTVDDATWLRGQGWALYLGLGAVHEYRLTNPVLAAIGRRAVAEVLADS